MTVYVIVEMFQDALQEARAYLTEASALNAEQNWLREMSITASDHNLNPVISPVFCCVPVSYVISGTLFASRLPTLCARSASEMRPPAQARSRQRQALLVACAEMYFQGVSTRKVSRVLAEMGGFELSASTVSRVAVELDERLSEFRNRRLDEVSWPFLMVDACYIKVRHHGSIKSRAVLVVAGINETGRRELLTWRVGDVESEATWSEVFSELRQRGVQGVQCVVSDGHAGIQAAAAHYFNDASWQRCWTHFMRSILTKASHKDKDVLSRELIAARKIEDVKICLAEAERIATHWEQRNVRIAIQIREQFEQTLAVHGLDNKHRRRVYTTNMLERVMREIKRRTRVVGIFPNDASCDRLVGAHLIEIHESWQCEKARYLCLDEALFNKRECHCKTLE